MSTEHTEKLFDVGDPDALTPADNRLVNQYVREQRSLDDLPYSPEFERMIVSANTAGDKREPRQLLAKLQNLRKAGRLPKLGNTPSKTPPIRVKPEEEAYLKERLTSVLGTLGSRDQLPYTAKMDSLASSFNTYTGRNLTPHDVWRLVMKITK
jgi:hypothetical protein